MKFLLAVLALAAYLLLVYYVAKFVGFNELEDD
jgi:hypothetical protein